MCLRSVDLKIDEAVLGYKFSSDCVSDVPHRLSNPEELSVAMAKGIEKIRCARSRDVVMEIHNLVSCLSHVFVSDL